MLTAARSMESAVNYPLLKRLPQQVAAAMTTNLRTSRVPVVYLTRGSIQKWNTSPVWTASALRALAGRRGTAASFVARNCASRNGREDVVKALDAALPGGVDRPGGCLNSRPWPRCERASKPAGKCSKHAVLRGYPFYLAFENSNEEDYVSEKVYHALEAGVLPVYMGAPNVADFVPPDSLVRADTFDSTEALGRHLLSLLDEPERYLAYFAWKRRPLPPDFQARLGFVQTHAKCRLCRWAYARKYRFPWLQHEQRPDLSAGRR